MGKDAKDQPRSERWRAEREARRKAEAELRKAKAAARAEAYERRTRRLAEEEIAEPNQRRGCFFWLWVLIGGFLLDVLVLFTVFNEMLAGAGGYNGLAHVAIFALFLLPLIAATAIVFDALLRVGSDSFTVFHLLALSSAPAAFVWLIGAFALGTPTSSEDPEVCCYPLRAGWGGVAIFVSTWAATAGLGFWLRHRRRKRASQQAI